MVSSPNPQRPGKNFLAMKGGGRECISAFRRLNVEHGPLALESLAFSLVRLLVTVYKTLKLDVVPRLFPGESVFFTLLGQKRSLDLHQFLKKG